MANKDGSKPSSTPEGVKVGSFGSESTNSSSDPNSANSPEVDISEDLKEIIKHIEILAALHAKIRSGKGLDKEELEYEKYIKMPITLNILGLESATSVTDDIKYNFDKLVDAKRNLNDSPNGSSAISKYKSAKQELVKEVHEKIKEAPPNPRPPEGKSGMRFLNTIDYLKAAPIPKSVQESKLEEMPAETIGKLEALKQGLKGGREKRLKSINAIENAIEKLKNINLGEGGAEQDAKVILETAAKEIEKDSGRPMTFGGLKKSTSAENVRKLAEQFQSHRITRPTKAK